MRLLIPLLLVAATGCSHRARPPRDITPDLLVDEAAENGEVTEEGPGLSVMLAAVPEVIAPVVDEALNPAPPSPAPAAEPAVEPAVVEPAATPAAVPDKDWLTPRPLTTEGVQGRAAWSPDGAQIVFESTRPGGLVDNPWPQIWLMNADGSRQRRVTMGIGRADRPAFAGGPRVLAYGSTHHSGITEPVEGARPLPADAELYRQDLDRGGFERLTEEAGYDADGTWCLDGSLAAFVSERAGDLDIYTLRPGTTAAMQLSTTPGADHSPAFDASCRQAVWVHDGEAGSALVGGLVSGRETHEVLALAARIEDPAFAGERIVFASDLHEPGGAFELYSVGRDGADLRRLTITPGSEQHPAPSPDGSFLLYTDDRGGSPQLVLSPLEPTWGSPVP